MDAAVPVDAKNARPPGTWKTAENAVSHSAHTHYCFRERMIENGESTSVAKPSTESDQAQTPQSRREPQERIRRPREPAAEVIGNDDVVATKTFDHIVQVLCSPLRTSNAVLESAPSLRSLGESLKNPGLQGCKSGSLSINMSCRGSSDFKTSKPPSGMMLQIQSLMRSRPLSWFVR